MTTTHHCVRVAASRATTELVNDALLGAGSTGLEIRDEATMTGADLGEVEVIGWFPGPSEADRAARSLAASALVPGSAIRIEVVEDPGWREAWRDHFHPLRFGERLWVAPPDEDPPAEALEAVDAPVVLRLLPSVAFGVGTHESTAMMLELIVEHLEGGADVLDVGCGTGILAMAAVALGAKRAAGIDIDDDAVAASRSNARDNGLDARCTFERTPLADVASRFDLVLANLSAPALIAEKASLVDHLAPGGLLCWSGLLASDLEEVGAPSDDCALVDERRRGAWVAQAWRRS